MRAATLPPPATSPAPKAGALLPPSNFPAGGFGDTASPRRVSLPFAAPTRAHSPLHEAAKDPAAAHPGGRGVTCPHRAAGAPPRPADRDGAADPLPGRAVTPSGRGAAALFAPAGAFDLPSDLRWSIPPRELAALAATILFATAAILWFAVLAGRL